MAAHLCGEERAAVARQAAELYGPDDATIQSVATQLGRSYTLTRELLITAGVTLRPKGGVRRRKTGA